MQHDMSLHSIPLCAFLIEILARGTSSRGPGWELQPFQAPVGLTSSFNSAFGSDRIGSRRSSRAMCTSVPWVPKLWGPGSREASCQKRPRGGLRSLSDSEPGRHARGCTFPHPTQDPPAHQKNSSTCGRVFPGIPKIHAPTLLHLSRLRVQLLQSLAAQAKNKMHPAPEIGRGFGPPQNGCRLSSWFPFNTAKQRYRASKKGTPTCKLLAFVNVATWDPKELTHVFSRPGWVGGGVKEVQARNSIAGLGVDDSFGVLNGPRLAFNLWLYQNPSCGELQQRGQHDNPLQHHVLHWQTAVLVNCLKPLDQGNW